MLCSEMTPISAKPVISIVVAIGKDRMGNNVIGKNNELLWHIPDDLKHFKAITMGHPIIMGRKTFESIGRVLPGRTNIVISRNLSWNHPGCVVSHSLPEALAAAERENTDEIFIIGGGEIYKETLPGADRLYLTLVKNLTEGDTFFPNYPLFTKKVSEEKRDFNGLEYSWVVLEKPLPQIRLQ